MASNKQQGVSSSVSGSEDGWMFIRGLEDKNVERYLETYGAKIDGYKQTPGDMFTNVTQKIVFPLADNEANVNLWAYFIVKACHPTASKPRIKVVKLEQGYAAYCTWPIWNQVKYMESKNKGYNFDF